MTARLGRFSPWAAPLFAQIIGLVLVSLVVTQAVNLALIFTLPPPRPDLYRLNEIADLLRNRPVAERTDSEVSRSVQPQPPADGVDRFPRESRRLREMLAAALDRPADEVRFTIHDVSGFGFKLRLKSGDRGREQSDWDRRAVRAMRGPDPIIVGQFSAAVRQADGRWAVVRSSPGSFPNAWERRVILWFLAAAAVLIPIAYVFARRLAAPIRTFATAAERLGRDPRAPAVDLRGPAEVAVAAQALNGMQQRLQRYVEDRTSMIGAIAHDLRTPLTRMRFRIETAPDELRTKLGADIEQMEAMIAATMAFVRGATEVQRRERLDLQVLLADAALDLSETGHDVTVEGGEAVTVDGDPVGLGRLVTNLMVNAVTFGRRARARTYREAGVVVIEVDDDGPGLPPDELDRVFEPFYRGERSRSRETGGIGLGLAVVRTVARGHGGDASLSNRPEGGLRARVTLPV